MWTNQVRKDLIFHYVHSERHSEDSDQIGSMPRLVTVSTGHKANIVGLAR